MGGPRDAICRLLARLCECRCARGELSKRGDCECSSMVLVVDPMDTMDMDRLCAWPRESPEAAG